MCALSRVAYKEKPYLLELPDRRALLANDCAGLRLVNAEPKRQGYRGASFGDVTLRRREGGDGQ